MTRSNLAMEEEHLAKAERDIAEGDGRVKRQVELIQHLQRNGGPGVAEAEGLLNMLQDTLQIWRDHRETVLRAIERLQGGATAAATPKPTAPAEPKA